MRRFLYLWVLVACINTGAAQINLTIQNTETCTNTVSVPIIIQEDQNLISLQFTVFWDGTGLSYNSLTDVTDDGDVILGPIPGGPNQMDTLTYAWANFGGHPFSAGDTIALVNLDVTGGVGTYPVSFFLDPHPSFPSPPEAGGPGFLVVPTATQNGVVTIGSNVPVFQNCPTPITMNNDPGDCGAIVNWTLPTVNDCDNNANPITNNGIVPGFLAVGTHTVVYNVSDTDGNMATCSFDIIINDTEAPTLNCPTDITQNVSPGTPNFTVPAALLTPTTNDNCGSTSVSYSFNGDTPGSGTYTGQDLTFDVGTTVVTYISSDGTNSSTPCMFTVIITELLNPISLDIGDVTTDCSNEITVPIVIQQDITLVSLEFTIIWDGVDGINDTGLTFNSIDENIGNGTIALGPLPVLPNNLVDTLTFSWTNFNGFGFSAGDVIANINFTVTPGVGNFHPILFYPGTSHPQYPVPIEAGGLNFSTVPVIPIDGSVTVGDNSPPTISCPPATTVQCGSSTAPAATGSATGLDDCVGVLSPTFSDVNDFTACSGTGTITRTWITDDGNGNSVDCAQTITIIDTTNPTFDSNPNTIANINCGDALPTQQNLTASDNCGNATVVPSVDAFNENCNGYSITYRWTATDECNNSTFVTQTFNVLADDVDPTFDSNPNTIADINCGDALPTQQILTASDNCGNATVVPSVDTFNENCNGYSITYRWTATDECDNSTVVTQTFNVLADDANPTFDSNPNTIADLNCGDALPTQQILTASDNCGNATVVSSVDAFDENCNGYSITYRWIATDECDNSTFVTQTFNVIADDIDPTFDSNPNTIADINCGDALPTQQILIASDNCGNANVVPSIDTFDENCNGYSITYRWTATDECDNSTFVTQTFNVLPDDIDPTFDSNPNTIADINCGEDLPIQQTLTASDNCGNATVVPSVDPFNEDSCNGYVVTYRWTATDDCNNSTVVTQIFNVLPDDIDPTFDNNPISITDVNCSDPLPSQQDLTASDNCGNATVVPSVDPFNEDLCNGYLVTYRWTATDDCNNSSFVTQSFNVLPDDTNPTFTVPATASVNCGEDFTDLSLTGDVMDEADNCDGEVVNGGIREASFSDDLSNLADCSGSILRTWTLTDICGNAAVFTQVINIVPDNIDPTFTVPNNVSIDCDDDINDLTLTGDVTDENDNCDSNVSNTGPTVATYSDDVSGLNSCDGQVIRTWTLTDFCGNTNTQNQTITISPDNEDPSFTVPADLTIACTDDPSDLSLTGNVNDEADNCSDNLNATFVDQNNLTECSNTGTITRTWTLVDDCGNDNVQTQTITVQDNVAPIVNCVQSITLELDSMGMVSIIPASLNDGSSDNCADSDDLSFSLPNVNFTCSDLGENNTNLTISDPCNNQSTCSTNIVIQDNIGPWIVCPEDITVTADDNVETAVVDNIGLVSSEDNCTIDNTNYSLNLATSGSGIGDASGSTFNVGQTLVSYEVSDNSGNTSTCVFRVNVLGNVRIECAADATIDATADLCSAVVNDIGVSIISDIETIDTVFYVLTGATTGEGPNDASGETFNVGITTVTYTVIDNFGEEVNCTVFVDVQDNQNPSISGCPDDITASANESCQAMVSWDPPTVEDNCPDVTITSSHDPNDLFEIGTTPVEYVAMDNSGNTDTCRFDVTVLDEMDPSIVCRTDTTVTISDVNNVVVNNLAPINFNDNCGIESITYTLTGATSGSGSNDASGDLFENGETMVTYTATDLSGNTASCNFKVIVNISSSNIIDCPGNQVIPTDDNLCSTTVTGIAPTIIIDLSNLDSVKYVISGSTDASGMDDASGIVFNPGTSTVTYTAYDAFGNIETCSFDVEIIDEENPTIQCPENVNTNTDNDLCSAIIEDIEAIVNDNCKVDRITYIISGTTSLSGTESASGSSFNLGVSSIQYTAFDNSENTAFCTFTVTVNDNQTPNITCPSNQVIENGVGNCHAVLSNISATATDNCAIESITYELTDATEASGTGNASGNTFNVGNTTVEYTATDESGNSTNCSFIVTVNDTEVPIVDCPNTVSVGLSSGGNAVIVNDLEAETLSDNCPTVTLSYELSGATTGSGNGNASGLSFDEGQTIVTYTATDNSGNTSICSFTVNVSSLVLACPENVSDVVANNSCEATINDIDLISQSSQLDNYQYVLSGATEGNGDGDVSGTTFNVGTTTVNYSAEDILGNTASCSFNVVITDNQNPIIACPTLTSFDLNENDCSLTLDAIDLAPANTFDNCPNFTLTYELSGVVTSSGALENIETNYPVGTTDVIYTITDQAGNDATCSFSIVVNDINGPSLTCPENVSQIADIGASSDIVNDIDGILNTDPCGPTTLDYELSGTTIGADSGNASGLAFNIGNTTVTYNATDINGNSSNCSFIISIIPDATGGEIIACLPDINTENDPGNCSAVMDNIAPILLTNASNISSISYSIDGVTVGTGVNDASGNTFNVGTSSVTYIAIDINGNTQSCSFNVTVSDSEIPTWTGCPIEIIVDANGNNCTGIASWTEPTAADNCGVPNVVRDLDSGDSFPLGTTNFVYTATDASGNSAVCNFTVTVQDVSVPIFVSCPSDIIVSNTTGSCDAVVNWDEAEANDECSDVSLISDISNGSTFNIGVQTVTYTASDLSGNTSTCSFTVTVNDTESPSSLDCPENIVIATTGGNCEATHTWTPPTFTDLCSTISVTSTHQPGDVFPAGQTTNVVYLAIDSEGNDATCSFQITVIDEDAPALSTCPENIVTTANELCQAMASWTAPTATDLCDQQVDITVDFESGSLFDVGQTTITYVATDGSGNSTTCNFTVQVDDTSAPVLACPENIVLAADGSIIEDPDGLILSANPGTNCNELIIEYSEASATDNCTNEVTINVQGLATGATFMGENIIEWEAIDPSQNSSICSFTITVMASENIPIEVSPNTSPCPGLDVNLFVTEFQGATYDWEGPSNWTGSGASPTINSVTSLNAGTYNVTCTLSNGCTSVGTTQLTVEDAPAIESISNGPLCIGTTLELTANTSGSYDSWSWTGPNGFSSTEQNPIIVNPGMINSGEYTVTGLTNAGCSNTSQVSVIISDPPTSPFVDLECDDFICPGESCMLFGTQYAVNSEYRWYVTGPDGIEIPITNNANTLIVSPMESGEYIYRYEAVVNGCLSESVSTTLLVLANPSAVDDVFDIEYESVLENFQITTNDLLDDRLELTIIPVTTPMNGSLLKLDGDNFIYTPQNQFLGTDVFEYQICYTCDGELVCDQATVTINVNFDGPCEVPDVITPNGDGFNDNLFITCLATNDFPNSEMIIYNKWGDEVFREAPYQNTWDGTWKGEDSKDLPDGTYYYVFKPGPSFPIQKGSLTIFR